MKPRLIMTYYYDVSAQLRHFNVLIEINLFFARLLCGLLCGNLPQDLRYAVIVSLYKNKGENQTVQTIEASLCPLAGNSRLAE